jgi:hypothetical protein
LLSIEGHIPVSGGLKAAVVCGGLVVLTHLIIIIYLTANHPVAVVIMQ